jgi:hypothetical protein
MERIKLIKKSFLANESLEGIELNWKEPKLYLK